MGRIVESGFLRLADRPWFPSDRDRPRAAARGADACRHVRLGAVAEALDSGARFFLWTRSVTDDLARIAAERPCASTTHSVGGIGRTGRRLGRLTSGLRARGHISGACRRFGPLLYRLGSPGYRRATTPYSGKPRRRPARCRFGDCGRARLRAADACRSAHPARPNRRAGSERAAVALPARRVPAVRR